MDDLRVINVKDLFFYLFLSWRTILASILLCCFLAGAYTYLKPAQMTTKEAAETAKEEVVFPEGIILIPPPLNYEIEDTENPLERYSTLEVQQMVKDFSEKNPEVRQLYDAIGKKEMENLELQESLETSPYLHIDPEHKVNKRLKISLSLAEDNSLDAYGKAFLRQNLCAAYLSTLRGGKFYQTLAGDYSITYSSDEMKRLVQLNLDSPNTILIKITAPDKDQRELLFKNCEQEILRIYEEGAVSYIQHTLSVNELPDETVKDSSIRNEREAIDLQIKENEELIQKNTKEIENKFYNDFANKVMLARSKKAREKAEAVQILKAELMGVGASEDDSDTIAAVIDKTKWDPKAIGQIKEGFLKALAYDKKQEELNLEKKIKEAEKVRAGGEETSAASDEVLDKREPITAFKKSLQILMKEETVPAHVTKGELEKVELVPLPKRYKRNLVFGFVLGLFIASTITLLRYRRNLFPLDLSVICSTQSVALLGAISTLYPVKRKRLCFLDKWVIRLFGNAFDEQQQVNEVAWAASALLTQVERKDNTAPYQVLIPGSVDNGMKTKLIELLKKADKKKQIEWLSSPLIGQSQEAIEALQNADGVLFLEEIKNINEMFIRDMKIVRNNNKKILGVLELKEKYQVL